MNQKLIDAMARAYALTEYGDGHDEPWEPFTCHAEIVLQAIEQAGFVVVPVEPNNTSLIAMATAHDKTEEGGKRDFYPLAAAYRATDHRSKGRVSSDFSI